MIESSAAAPQVLDEIVARLISAYHPRRIYLFGSRARGDAHPDSDYDLLVEIAATRAIDDRIKSFDIPGLDVQLHIRSPGQIERSKDDPGTVDWDAVREGMLLYSWSDIPILKPGRVREHRRRTPPSLRGWLRRAEKDLRLARHVAGLPPDDWEEDIAYHSQQSAEKYLKALIIAQGKRPARTHKLLELLQQARDLGLRFEGFDRTCLTLSRYAVAGRYPARHAVTPPRARRALAGAERIAALVLAYLK